MNSVHKCNFYRYRTTLFFLKSHQVGRHREPQGLHKFVCHNSTVLCDNECIKCNFVGNITAHQKTNIPEKKIPISAIRPQFICKQCEFCTFSKLMLTKHQCKERKPPSPTIRRFQCEVCEFESKQKINLQAHMLVRHRAPEETQSDHCQYKSQQNSTLKRQDDSQWFYCKHCAYKTKWHNNLKKHVVLYHTGSENWFQCKRGQFLTNQDRQCKKRTKLILTKHQSEKKTRTSAICWFQCELCEFESKQKINLQAHMLARHRAQEETQSDHCQYKSQQNPTVKRQDDSQQFHCELCGYNTKWQNNWSKHLTLYHTGLEKWFQCKHCQFKTNQEGNLKSHVNLHHSDIWYQCAYCALKTKWKGFLKNHIILEHVAPRDIKFVTFYQQSIKIE